MNKICIILIGLPGCGKSWFRTKLLGMVASKQQQLMPIWTTISTDDIVEDFAKSRGETYSESWPNYIKEAERIAFAQLKYAADSGDDVIIVDRTHMDAAARAKVMITVLERNSEYRFIALDFRCSDPVWSERLNSRPGKIIPAAALQGMAKRYQSPSLAEGFAHIEMIHTTRGEVDIRKYYHMILNMMEGKSAHTYRI